MNKQFLKMDKSLFRVTTATGTVSLFAFTIPMILEQILNASLGTVNTAVLSQYSEEAVAGVGAASSVLSVISILFTIISVGTTVVVGQYIGANQKEALEEVNAVATLLSIFISMLVIPCGVLFSRYIFTSMNLYGEILEYGLLYFRIRLIFYFVEAVTNILASVLRCYGYINYTVIRGIASNFLNLLLNILVVYYPQYAPVHGVKGVAFSCVIGQVLGLVIILIGVKREKIGFKMHTGHLWEYTKKILSIGIPSGISGATFGLSQTIVTAFIASVSLWQLSAKVYFGTISSYVYIFSCTLGTANSMLIGRLYGAGELKRASELNKQLIRITVPMNFILSLCVILSRKTLLTFFTDDVKIINLALAIFLVDLVVEQARAVSQIYEYALRGAGDVFFMFAIMIASCTLFSVGLSYVLVVQCRLGLLGYWIALAIDEGVRALASWLRWKYKMNIWRA